MRIWTGVIVTILFLCGFSFVLLQVTAEMSHVKSINQVLDDHVKIEDVHLSTNSYILDRNNELISEIYRDYNRIYLPIEEIPPLVIHAFLATEDRRFFEHKGYDASAIFRAFFTNLRSNSIEQGASTVTQQLVRNYYLGHEQTYDRKLSELLYAYQLEKVYDKEEIIELYINTIFFQNGIYGFEAASRFYFNKPSNELTLGEIAFLSAIPNNPTHYNPLKHSDRTIERQKWILNKMLEVEVISNEEFNLALEETIELSVTRKVDMYPDYVTYIHHEFTQLVAEIDGFNEKLRSAATDESRNDIQQKLTIRVNELLESGVTIHTALEPSMQQKAISTVERYLPQGDIQGAVTVIDHHAHEIVAITGGKDYKKFDFHRGFQSFRQPGSSIKPLLSYGPYLAEYDVRLQSPINANNFCKNGYCPRNFGGGQYGDVTLETAFKHSYNTPAVRILDRIGIENGFSYLEKFSFSQVESGDYRLPAALGGFTYGMSSLEMSNAYTTFANNGQFQPSYGIRKVTDSMGDTIYEWNPTSKEVWDIATNDRMRTLLSKVLTEGTGRNAAISGGYAGGKTGTTSSYQDLWFIGLNDNYTTGVWVGKDKPASLQNIYSQTPHLSIWREIMR
ncbi:transglycosylase domain-containing protein [Bacillus sp. FJAT-45350]|uniref:transglycosylase domain-containing protein n=1 Tax=Bacillus sp. FJAT-45350 TaxID=2011014 RepID=UPI00211C8781|nr:transglycosylase domain-containing protein [Bacillus sp. FJAT-45350]